METRTPLQGGINEEAQCRINTFNRKYGVCKAHTSASSQTVSKRIRLDRRSGNGEPSIRPRVSRRSNNLGNVSSLLDKRLTLLYLLQYFQKRIICHGTTKGFIVKSKSTDILPIIDPLHVAMVKQPTKLPQPGLL